MWKSELNETLVELGEGDGVRVVVSDEPVPVGARPEAIDVSFTGSVSEVHVGGSERDQHVEVYVDADHVPRAEDEWRERARIESGSDNGTWRRPAVWLQTGPFTGNSGDEEIRSSGTGWRALGLLGELKLVANEG